MKTCIAFIPDGPAPQAWRPCRSSVRPGCVFCRNHERAIAGIVLGICVHDYPDQLVQFRKAAHDKATLEQLPVKGSKPS